MILTPNDKYTAIDLFCGAGGMSLGASLAGIDIVAGIDFDKHAVATFKNNHNDAIGIEADIRKIEPLEYFSPNIFLLLGGPPCQGYSVANTKTRNLENPNNWMFKEYFRFIQELKPSWFVFENVAGFSSFAKGEIEGLLHDKARKLGYSVSSKILDAVDYGVPQKRRRYFMVGHRIDQGGCVFDFDKIPTLDKVNVGEAILDLPILKNGDYIDRLDYVDSYVSKYSTIMRKNSYFSQQNFVSRNKDYIIDRYKVIMPGENWKAAHRVGLMGNYTSTKNTHSGIYKRLEINKPSVTIANYRKSMLIHPLQDRGLSLREAARIQSFPDDFIFLGSLSYMQQQVGNAVPPLLAKAIFEQILRAEKSF